MLPRSGRIGVPLANSMAGKSPLPPSTLWIAAALFLLFGIGPNTLLSLAAIGVLVLGAWLLWRPGESPILLAVFGFQWLQASIKVFQANWLNVEIEQLAPYGGDIQGAVQLCLAGLIVLALAMRLGAGPWRQQDGALVRSAALERTPNYWFRLYAIAFVGATLVQSIAWLSPGLAQPLLALANLKWAFYWILAYATFARPNSPLRYWLVAFCLEMSFAAGGFFADFKTPLFFTIFAAVGAQVRFTIAKWLGLVSLVALLVVLGVVWTSVKKEYRDYVSGGSGQQVITVSYPERIGKLADLVSQLDGPTLEEGGNDLLDRLSYVDFFGVILTRVPRRLPHEDGAILWDAFTRPFMPRFFFPEKTSIDDSVRMNHYTGLNFAGADRGTSISIGYMAESYIDFGAVGMMFPIFALGYLMGRVYRWMLDIDPSRPLLGMAFATAAIYLALSLESSITKTFGGLVVSILVSWIVLRFGAAYFFPAFKRAYR